MLRCCVYTCVSIYICVYLCLYMYLYVFVCFQFLGQLAEEEELEDDEDRYVDGEWVAAGCCSFADEWNGVMSDSILLLVALR